MFSYDLIDRAIGEEAGNYHGYTFLILLLYPLLLAIYGTIMWLADKSIKGRVNKALSAVK